MLCYNQEQKVLDNLIIKRALEIPLPEAKNYFIREEKYFHWNELHKKGYDGTVKEYLGSKVMVITPVDKLET